MRTFGKKPMQQILSYLIPAAIVALLILILWKLGNWAISDAKLRGKSPFLVFVAVIFFFPWGLIAWLIFRPDPP